MGNVLKFTEIDSFRTKDIDNYSTRCKLHGHRKSGH